MVTDTDPFPYPCYHTEHVTPDKTDFARFAKVVDGLEAVAAALASAVLGASGPDPVE